jgi:HAMP domain-containing protein
MFVIPTALIEGTLIVLYRRGVFQDVGSLLLAVLIGLAAMMAYLSWIAYALGRPVIRTVRMIQAGTELMTTVNPDHRIEVRTGDELEALAEDINELADHLREAKGGLSSSVAAGGRGRGRDPRWAHHAHEPGRPGAADVRRIPRRTQPVRPRRSVTGGPVSG